MMIEDRIAATASLLLAACREMGVPVTGDLRVTESTAAELLGLNPESLKHMRHEGRGPVSYRCSVNGSRQSYRIDDLSAWIEANREEW